MHKRLVLPVHLAQVQFIIHGKRGNVFYQWMIWLCSVHLVRLDRGVGHELATQNLHERRILLGTVHPHTAILGGLKKSQYRVSAMQGKPFFAAVYKLDQAFCLCSEGMTSQV